jgi:hypothetical protein
MLLRRAGIGLTVLCSILVSAEGFAAAPLFPKPFHLVREVDDALAGRVLRVDEYYAGDRVITIRGDRTAIADYAKQELTDIDRAHATYSVATFAQVAAAQPAVPQPRAKAQSDAAPTVMRKGSERRAGRSVDIFSADDPRAGVHADVAVDAAMTLSRDAFDVVAGGAFPKRGGAAADLVRGASARANGNDAYGLPLEQVLRYTIGGETVVVTTRVVAIDDRTPPAELSTIPPGARRVEARPLQARRIGDDSESLVPGRNQH